MRSKQLKKSRVVTFRLDSKQEKKLVALAGAKGVGIGTLLRELVDNAPDPLVVWNEVNTDRLDKAN